MGQELLTNGTFDSDLAGWSPPVFAGSAMWSGFDSEGAPGSGSAIVITTTGSGTGQGMFQCVLFPPDSNFEAQTDYRVPTGQLEPGSFHLLVLFFSGADCNDLDFLQAELASSGSLPPNDSWSPLEKSGISPSGTQSAKFVLRPFKETGATSGEPFEIHADRASLLLQVGGVFSDGFESGDMGAWSSSSP